MGHQVVAGGLGCVIMGPWGARGGAHQRVDTPAYTAVPGCGCGAVPWWAWAGLSTVPSGTVLCVGAERLLCAALGLDCRGQEHLLPSRGLCLWKLPVEDGTPALTPGL